MMYVRNHSLTFGVCVVAIIVVVTVLQTIDTTYTFTLSKLRLQAFTYVILPKHGLTTLPYYLINYSIFY